MKTECPSFEEFEKLFEDESYSRHDVPKFNQEWTRGSNGTILFASEAGVFVLSLDILQFSHVSNHEIVFNISYEINDEFKSNKLIANVGKVNLNSSSIFSKDLDVTSWNFEKYKNLLAITCASDAIVDMEITFQNVSCDIENFLQNKLHFEIIKSLKSSKKPKNLESQSSVILLSLRSDYFLYCSNGYFQGVLIRLNLQSDLLMKAKVYVRSIHQLIILTQSIYEEYSNQCSIEIKKFYENAKK